MGFFAGELEVVLQENNPIATESPWTVLIRMNLHPQQSDRLQQAAMDIGQVATLPHPMLERLKSELNLSPMAWARLEAGIEADALFRLMMYHNYPLEQAVSQANGVFSSVLKDKLVTGGQSDSIYPSLPELDALANVPSPRRRRGRMTNTEKNELLAKQAQEALALKHQMVAPAPPQSIVPALSIPTAIPPAIKPTPVVATTIPQPVPQVVPPSAVQSAPVVIPKPEPERELVASLPASSTGEKRRGRPPGSTNKPK